MVDEQETKSLYAAVEGNSAVGNWASKVITVEDQIILDTDDGKVMIKVTDDGKMEVGPIEEVRGY